MLLTAVPRLRRLHAGFSPLTPEFRTRANQCETCGHSDTATGFSHSTSVSTLSILVMPRMVHNHLRNSSLVGRTSGSSLAAVKQNIAG
jgi:hypothetical protein